MRYFILVFYLFLTGHLLTGQCEPHQEHAYQAYLTNSPDDWDQAIDDAKQLPKTADNLFTLAHYLHSAGTSAWLEQDGDRADDYLKRENEAIDALWELDEDHPGAHGLYSGYLGMLIAQNPIKGMLYGSKSANYARKGVTLDGEDRAANYFSGSQYFYTPEQWGGDNALALAHLEKAAAGITAEVAECDFFALEILALYGQTQARAGDKDAARLTYLQALRIEPDFIYVKDHLLPALDTKR